MRHAATHELHHGLAGSVTYDDVKQKAKISYTDENGDPKLLEVPYSKLLILPGRLNVPDSLLLPDMYHHHE